MDQPDLPGQGLRHPGDGVRVGRALVRTRLPRAPPRRGPALLHALQQTDPDSNVGVCSALAAFDVRDRLPAIGAPVLAVAATHDMATPPELLRAIADGAQDGSFAELDGVAHLAPAEAPGVLAGLLRRHF